MRGTALYVSYRNTQMIRLIVAAYMFYDKIIGICAMPKKVPELIAAWASPVRTPPSLLFGVRNFLTDTRIVLHA